MEWYSKAMYFNSLSPERCGAKFECVILQHILRIDILSISCEITLKWIPQIFTDDKLTLIQVMAWCHQAPSHYLNQWWPSSLSPYDVTRGQWVKMGMFSCRKMPLKWLWYPHLGVTGEELRVSCMFEFSAWQIIAIMGVMLNRMILWEDFFFSS